MSAPANHTAGSRPPRLDVRDGVSHERTAPLRLLDADALAATLGCSRGWVYRHADELGVVRVGRALRFDLEVVLARLTCPADKCTTAQPQAEMAAPSPSMPDVPKPLPKPAGSILRCRPIEEVPRATE